MAGPDDVGVVAPDGKVVAVARGDLEQAQNEGYRVASPDEVEAQRRRRELESVGGMAKSAAFGAARGLTLGLSDAAYVKGAEAAGRGADVAGQEIADIRDANPNISAGAEFAAAMLGTKGVGGVGRAGSLASRVVSPVRGVAALGARTEQALAATRFGKGMLPMVARNAVEGLGFGAGQAISDAFINNTDLSAEKLAAGALQGGALGAGTAGALGLAGAGVGALFRKGKGLLSRALSRPGAGVDDLGNAAFGKAAPGLRGKVVDLLDSASSTATGSKRGAINDLLSKAPDGRLRANIAMEADDIIAGSGDELFESLSKMQDTLNRAGRRFKGDLKIDQVRRAIDPADAAKHVAAARQTTSELMARVDDMLADPMKYAAGGKGAKWGLNKLKKRIAQVESAIDNAVERGSGDIGTQSYMWLDDLRKRIGTHAEVWTNKRRATTDVVGTAHALQDMYDGIIRPHLTNEAAWGKAAALQSNVNAPWSAAIGTGKKFHPLFTKGESGKWNKRAQIVDRKKVHSFLANLKKPENADDLVALERHLDSMEAFTKAAGDNMVLSKGDRAAIQEMAADAKRVRQVLARSKDAVAAQNQYKSLVEASGRGGDVNALLGGALGGAPGALFGAVGGIVMNPAQTVRRAAALHGVLRTIDGKTGAAAAKLAKGAVRRGTLGAGRAASQQGDYIKRATTTRAAAQQPQAIEQAAARTLAPIGDNQTTQKAAGVYTRAQTYLATQLPQLRAAGLLSPEGKPGEADVHRYMRAAQIIDNPSQLLVKAADGSLTSAEVHAVAEVYPEWYGEMQVAALDEIAELNEKGSTLPYNQRIALGVMLQVPTDPMLEPGMLNLLQSTYQKPDNPPPQRRMSAKRADAMATAYETGSERLLAD